VRRGLARSIATALVALLWMTPAAGFAQEEGGGSSSSRVAGARDAYAEVDFDGTVRLAAEAIEGGGMTLEETNEAYRLLGLAHAALGNQPEARSAFVRLLAIDPDVRLERRLSPALRSPYMEARGYWAQYRERLSIQARLGGERLTVAIGDPTDLAETVRIRHRLNPGDDYESFEGGAAPRVELEVGERAELVVELLDSHGNTLARLGTELEPHRVGVWETGATGEPVYLDRPADPLPFIVGGAVGIALGLGGIGTGIYFCLERERLAEQWNTAGQECNNPGVTRGDVCRDVLDDLETSEVLAGVFYGIGGAFTVVGALLFILMPSGDGDAEEGEEVDGEGGEAPADAAAEEAWIRCGPGLLSFACEGRF